MANNTLGAYNDLQYANYTPIVQQRPVNELKDLYKTKSEQYNYVANAVNQLDTAISSTPHLDEDRSLLEEAKTQLTSAIEEYGNTGDFENRVLDINRLVKDVGKKLVPIQERKQRFDSYTSELMSKDKDGRLKHSMDDIKKGIYLTKRQIKPMQYDEDLGTYIGEFSGVPVPTNINYSEKVAKILDDWKSNKITLTDKNGNLLERIPGTGKLRAGTKEYTDDSELIQAAKSYLLNDPDFIDKYKFDLDYELTSLLDNEGRAVNLDDIRNIVSGDLKTVSKDLGLNPNKSLEDQVKEGDITEDELYRRIRLEQITNSAIKLGVSKESYTKFEDKFLKDDLLLKALDWQNKNRINGKTSIESDANVAIHTITTDNIINPSNYNSILSGKDSAKQILKENQRTLNLLRQSNSGTPQQIDQLERTIKEDQNSIENYERQLKSIREFIQNKSNFSFDSYYNEYSSMMDTKRQDYIEDGHTIEETNKDLPKLNLDDYKNEVINKFVNGDTFTVFEDFITGIGKNHRLDVAAEALMDSFGGSIENTPYTVDYHTYLIEGDSKDSKLYTNYVSNKKKAFLTNPNTFTYNNNNFEILLKEKYDLNMDEIDLSKSDIYPTIESINKKPGFIIDVAIKDGDGKIIKGNTKLTVNYEGGLLDERDTFREISEGEAYRRFKDKDLSNLDLQDKAMFRKLSLSWLDNSPIGNKFDNLNLYVQRPGIPVNFKMDELGINFNITPQVDALSQQEGYDKLVYNLSTPDGKVYLERKDSNGNIETIWDRPTSGDIPIDFQSPSEIKETLASSLLSNKIHNKRNAQSINPYEEYINSSPIDNNLQDMTYIFGNTIKEGVSPYFNIIHTDHLKSLKSDYPNLFLTDVYRTSNNNTGSPTSDHKVGDAFDVRINNESLKLFKLSKEDLKRKYGIVLIEPHNGSKGRVSNWSDADHFHIKLAE